LPEQDAVNALVFLGVRISRGPGDRDTKRKLKAKPSTDEEYELSRYKPLLRTVLEDHATGRLDAALFPYVKDAPLSGASAAAGGRAAAPPPQTTSLRSAKANWNKNPRAATALADTRQRLLVFVAGGMTYSEMREAYALSGTLGREVIVGATHTFTPREFVDDLKVLELGGVGSRALPNGVRDPGGKRPYQDFYDQYYFLKDAPPKARPPPPQPERSRLGLSRPAPVSQSTSTSSITPSTYSTGASEEKEKKKKRNLFRF
jgi:syntaxin-binding protein 1